MQPDVIELAEFYRGRLGQVARRLIRRRIRALMPDTRGLNVLGLGYATPYLRPFRDEAARVIAVMPAAQGVMRWPAEGRNLVALAEESELPLPDASIDRVVMVHALESTEQVRPMLREVWRVLAPSGRVVVAVTARNGLWANTEKTPYGHGRPYSRTQLGELLPEAELEPSGWTRALYVPPVSWMARWAEGFEQTGSRLWPGFAGLLLMEAVKQTFAVKPKGLKAPARVFVPGALKPARLAHPEERAPAI